MLKPLSIICLTLLLSACGMTAHHNIALKRNDLAKQQLEQSGNLNELTVNGTPLCAAAMTNNMEMVRYLLDKGAQVNYGNAEGYLSKSPLHAAAGVGAVGIAELLLANGADLSSRNRENLTPLELARAEGHPEMVELLAQYESAFTAWEATKNSNSVTAYQQFLRDHPGSMYADQAQAQLQTLQMEAQKQAALDAMEAQLPVSVRRDKYMLQLSNYLKQQDYQKALEIFPKLEALPTAIDPSFNYFYGEALLRTNQPQRALEKLYRYVNQQGSGATHYTPALQLINQAESRL
ncbi:ankyrin repeat domain-containing protein [Marinobacterium lutimaris]|uniref:Ankyrin repeat-containing protein n=1 Tax=Marinobacterium lutimaris TaxID=568106 RepID=A0A1H6DEV6_9GAMM|nr:ankyrin repeat domain-containing protein [Marinobacterium lutimaris]SEG83761.1 Ankyrin repeat-containing protein [Marinobacterium lutimaris]